MKKADNAKDLERFGRLAREATLADVQHVLRAERKRSGGAWLAAFGAGLSTGAVIGASVTLLLAPWQVARVRKLFDRRLAKLQASLSTAIAARTNHSVKHAEVSAH